MTQTERIEVETDTVGCDGGGGALGHPMVSLKIVPKGDAGEGGEKSPETDGDSGSVVCPYCSRHFVLKSGISASAGH
ncbi:MAG: zinc-finger domain-containing protein [Rhodospirillales bacterium]|nr:zinc-finger domain-containing protein [Alphaproteobacteria bacterium]MBL6948563.1 zinc-finger domain-containing protein [Rhodospirillales bacterium]